MSSRTAQMLTKRRAVDFCRVATAMCTSRPVPDAA
ncbi:MAG: putative leader peptide [Trebonia sp.]